MKKKVKTHPRYSICYKHDKGNQGVNQEKDQKKNMNNAIRYKVSIDFHGKARTRMIRVRGNYKKDKGTSYTKYAEHR